MIKNGQLLSISIILQLQLVYLLKSSDTYSEQLNIHQLPNNYFLNNFTFTFDASNQDSQSGLQKINYFPLQFSEFLRLNPELSHVELDLVQGRFQDSALKRISDYSNQQFTLPNFEEREPGLSIKYRLNQQNDMDLEENQAQQNELTKSVLQEKLFGLLSSIFSVAIFEQRDSYVQLQNPCNEGKIENFYYFSKPYEAMCKENLSFIIKTLKLITFDTGISTLLQDLVIHQSLYKHLKFIMKNESGQQIIQFQISYLTQINDKRLQSIDGALNVKGDMSIIKCAICSGSSINLNYKDAKIKSIYNFKQVSSSEPLPVKLIRLDKSQFQDIELKVKELQSERYVADLHFAKEGTLYHKLSNHNLTHDFEVEIQEAFPNFLRPFIHSLRIIVKEIESEQVTEIQLDYDKIKLEFKEDSSSILRLKNLKVPAYSELVISVQLRKHLNGFEDYPNDPNRGFNIPQMPIYFRKLGLNDSQNDGVWQEIYSKALLIQTLEPDFSMPFNVNAVTNALIGFLFINTYNVLVKPKRLIYRRIMPKQNPMSYEEVLSYVS
eukprot:403364016